MVHSSVANKGIKSSQDWLAEFQASVQPAIRGYDYFVDWSEPSAILKPHETTLEALDKLQGATTQEAEDTLRGLLSKQPGRTGRTLALLLALNVTNAKDRYQAVRTSEFGEEPALTTVYFPATREEPDAKFVEPLIEFSRETKLLRFLTDTGRPSLGQYAHGVIIGTRTNARKNRAGTAMETEVRTILEKLCNGRGWKTFKVDSREAAEESTGLQFKVGRTSYKPDFIVRTNTEIFVIEVNFYHTSGSKLAAVAGNYKPRETGLKGQGAHFIWITDGDGWRTSSGDLKGAAETLDFVVNLGWMRDGTLEKILENPLDRVSLI